MGVGCFKKEKSIPIPSINDLLLMVYKDSSLETLHKIVPYRTIIPGAHDLIMTLLYYKPLLRIDVTKLYYDTFVDHAPIIEEAELCVDDILKDPRIVMIITPRTSKKLSLQITCNYIVTHDDKILKALCDASDYDSDMYGAYNNLSNLLNS
jgi:hypothetical protein